MSNDSFCSKTRWISFILGTQASQLRDEEISTLLKIEMKNNNEETANFSETERQTNSSRSNKPSFSSNCLFKH